ncbi:hypothetical protein ACFU7Y_32040 [Kitasatospora sp. NPDC057542]|uniref:hypothetical protein n=1 Tax=Kitasatospora sp. NPDC057542 TaxID=3346162 RepID=UPI00367A29AD
MTGGGRRRAAAAGGGGRWAADGGGRRAAGASWFPVVHGLLTVLVRSAAGPGYGPD